MHPRGVPFNKFHVATLLPMHAPQAIKSGFDKAKEVVVGKPDDKDGKPKKDEKKAAAK